MPLSSNAPFNEFGNSMILRDIEQLYLTLNGAGSGSAGEGQTQDQSTAVTQASGDSGGLPDLSGLATIDYVDQQDNDIYEYVDNAVAGISPDPPVGGDLSGVASNASVIKLRGVSISSTAPSVDEQVMMYNLPLTKWEPVQLIASNGGVLSKDSGGLIEIAGGTALSVVGNATNTTGSINAIAAASADTVLGRRGTALTWAKVSKAEMADAAGVSVIGRSVNSTGVTADIAASADNYILGRRSGVLTWAKVARAEMADGSACSVIGRSANSTGVTADISASADGQILNRLGSSLTWSDTPQVIRSGTTFHVCNVNTFTTSTTAPSSSASKGEMYFIY